MKFHTDYFANGKWQPSRGASSIGLAPPANVTSGYFVAPTIFGKVDPASVLAREEIFGPVLATSTYETEEEAVTIANGTPYGRTAAVWSAGETRAGQVASRLQAGQLNINGGMFNPIAPFGGYKQSGNGRELGRFGLEEFSRSRPCSSNHRRLRPGKSPAQKQTG